MFSGPFSGSHVIHNHVIGSTKLCHNLCPQPIYKYNSDKIKIYNNRSHSSDLLLPRCFCY